MGFTGPFGRAFQPPFATAGAAAPAGNGLLNNLIAYWPGNEAAGNALDLHTNALHLTDVNTVTSNPGLVYALARQYTRINVEYHTRPGDDALLSTGDVDFTLATFCRMDSKPAGIMNIAGKWRGAAGFREYAIIWENTTDRFWFQCRNAADGANINAIANTFGAPALNVWYLIIGWHDSVTNTVNISINNGGTDSAALVGGVLDGGMAFRLGITEPAAATAFDGRIGPTMFWKSNAGLGGVLTAAQKTALYNAGAGLTYAAFTL